MQRSLKVLVVEPCRTPVVKEIGGDLRSLQQVVGGPVEVIYPFDEAVALVCHEEGKLLGLPYNRTLRNAQSEVYDIVCGTFFLVGAGAEDFVSLTEEQIKTYFDLYDRERVTMLKKSSRERGKERKQRHDKTDHDR